MRSNTVSLGETMKTTFLNSSNPRVEVVSGHKLSNHLGVINFVADFNPLMFLFPPVLELRHNTGCEGSVFRNLNSSVNTLFFVLPNLV